jgi:hypothetical protein
MDKALIKTAEKKDAATRVTRTCFTMETSFHFVGESAAMGVTSRVFLRLQMGFC